MKTNDYTRLALKVGRTKRYLEEGKTPKEIAEILKISKEEVEGLIQIIETAAEK